MVQGGGGGGPVAGPTGDVLVRFDLQPRIVTNTVTGFRFLAFDAAGNVVFGPRETGRVGEVRLSGVPVTATRLRIELLRNGVLVGVFEATIVVREGQTTEVTGIEFSDVVPASQLSIQPSEAVLSVGQTASFTVTSRPNTPQAADVTAQATWASSNPAVLRVDGPGRVTALSAGTVDLTATFAGETAVSRVTVTNAVLTEIRLAPSTDKVLGTFQYRLVACSATGPRPT